MAGSGPPVTVAVFVGVVVALASRVPVSVHVIEDPAGISTAGQVAVPLLMGQGVLSASAFMLAPVTPVGTVSVTTTSRAREGPLLETVTRHWICCPGTTGLVSSALETVRSACVEGVLVGEATAVWVGVAGSGPPVTVTVLVGVTVALASRVPVSVHIIEEPAGISTAGQVAVLPLIGQLVPSDAVIAALLTPAGTVSVTTTSRAREGPLLETVTRHWICWPGTTGSVSSALETVRLACAEGVLVGLATAVCVGVAGSGPPVTVAVLAGVVVALASSVPVSVQATEEPAGISTAGQVAVPPLIGQLVPSVAAIEALFTPAGTVSVTTTSRAREGPLLVTVTRHWICWPGTTGLVSRAFDTVRLACGVGEFVGEATAVCVGTDGSGPPVTVAVLAGVAVASWASVPVSVQVSVCPTGISTAGQVARPLLIGQLAPSASAFIVALLTPAGTWSVTTTSRAREGPLLVTLTRHWICCPGTTGLVRRTFDVVRFACGVGEFVGEATAVCVGTDGSGPPVTVAVFVGVAVASWASVPVSVQVRVWPTGISTAGQVAVPLLIGQGVLSASAFMLAPVTPAGTVSVTTTPRAREGPLLVTLTRHWICCPGTTGLVSSTFDTVRLACGAGVLVGEATAVCVGVAGSGPPVTVALLGGVVVALASSVPVSVQVRVCPAWISTAGQVAVPPLMGHGVPSAAAIEALPTPAGTWSVTTTFRAREGPLLVTVTRHWICWPGTTGLVSSDFDTVRFACGAGVLVGEATAVWVGVAGSGPPVTVAVFVGVVVALASSVPPSVQVRVCPAGISTAGQVATPLLIGQLAPPVSAVIVAPVMPVGTWSVTTTSRAREGPLLVTVTRHWICWPGTTGLVSSDFDTVRFACGAGVLVGEATAVWVGVAGSGPPVTVAVFVGVVVALASRVPVRVQLSDEPAGISTAGQVATPPLIGQLAPPVSAVIDAPLTPAGTWSRTTTSRARDGPLLVTVTRHWICWPGTTGLVSSDFETVRFACGEGLVVGEATAVRVDADGSGPPLTVTEFTGVEVALASSVPVRVQVCEEPAGISTAGQVAVPPMIGQPVPSEAVITGLLTPAGTWSVTTTFRAREGPLLVTVTRHWIWRPGTTGSVSRTLETVRLACGEGEPEGDATAVWVDAVGSGPPVTVTMLAGVVVALASRVPVRVQVWEEPAGISTAGQVAVPPLIGQPVPSEAVITAPLTPAGIWSRTTTSRAREGPLLVTVTRHWICWPGTTGLVSSDFDTVRFACGDGEPEGEATAVWVDAVGSGPPVTVTVFVGVAVAFGSSVPVSVQFSACPAGISTAGQVAVPPLIGQVLPSGAVITGLFTPAGTVSVTATFRARDGPALKMLTRHSIRCPGTTGLVTRDLLTLRLACGDGEPEGVATAVWEEAAGSGPPVTVTVFVGVVVALASRVPVRVQLSDEPAGISTAGQVATPPLIGQLAPPVSAVIDAPLTPAGTWSVTTTFRARDGPLLVTVTRHWTG